MKLNDALDLIKEVFECPLMESKEGLFVGIDIPRSTVFDASAEGCKLRIDTLVVNEPSRNCLKSIVEKRKLKMIESKGYLVIYTPRKE